MPEPPRMLRVIAVALAAFLAMSVSAEAKLTPAALSALNCDQAEVDVAFSPAALAGSPGFQKELSYYQTHFLHSFKSSIAGCKDLKRRNQILAMQNGYTAVIQHAIDPDSDWQTPMNLANQQLTRCITDYFGQTKGAECQTQLDKNVRLKVSWETATPAP